MGKRRSKRKKPQTLWGVLVREAMKDYRAGRDQSLRDYAKEHGLTLLADEPKPEE